MSHQKKALEKIIRRQLRFQKALQERVNDKEAKDKQLAELAAKNNKKKPTAQTTE